MKGLDLASYLFIIVCIFLLIRERWKNFQITKQYEEKLDKISKQAIAKSKTVIRGKISEEFAPLFEGFPYQMSDCKFSGQPIDYLIFKGMSGLRDDKEGEIEIIFADVKSGNAALTSVQRKIRDAIKNQRVRFEIWNIKDNKFTIKV